jgi:hypothetical protein
MNQFYSETLEFSWNIESNSIELVRSKRIEFFQYFDVFSSYVRSIQMHQIHHVKSFKCNKTDFGSTEPNSKKDQNIEKVPRTHV